MKELRGGPGDRRSPALPSNSPPNPHKRMGDPLGRPYFCGERTVHLFLCIG